MAARRRPAGRGQDRRLIGQGSIERRMSISTPFIRRPVATSLLMAALVLVGIAAYPLLPVAPLPRVDFPTIVGDAPSFPAQAPRPWRRTVAQPLEYQFAQIPGVAQLTSVSVLGSTQHHGAVRSRPQHRRAPPATCRRRSMPPAGSCRRSCRRRRPTGRSIRPTAPIMILAVQSDAMPLIEVDDYAENMLSQQISQIAGVAQVLIGGQQKRAVRVQVDPDKLAAMGMTLEDVRSLLVSATVNAPKGTHRRRRISRSPIYDNDQLTQGRASTTTSCWPTATARRCGCATSAARSTGRRTGCSPAGRTASAASC